MEQLEGGCFSGYCEGLDALDTKLLNHFEENVNVYAFLKMDRKRETATNGGRYG